MKKLPITVAKAKLPDIVRQIETTGEPVMLTRHNKDVAVLLSANAAPAVATMPVMNADWPEELRALHAATIESDIDQ